MKQDRHFTTTCLSKRRIAPGVYELRFKKPEALTFVAGQFLLFDVPIVGKPDDIQPRAYSIASTPSENDLLFVIKLVPNGRASQWIEASLDAGHAVRMQGPFGNFRIDPHPQKQYVFVATGTGIAPMRSLIMSTLQDARDMRAMHLLFGVLRHDDLFWMEEWRALEREYPNLRVHISCLSGEADDHGETGSLQERLPRILSKTTMPSVYICGAPSTVKELKEQCLHLNLPKTDVHFESFL